MNCFLSTLKSLLSLYQMLDQDKSKTSEEILEREMQSLLLEKMYCLFHIYSRPLLKKLYPLEYKSLIQIMSILTNYQNMENKDLPNLIP